MPLYNRFKYQQLGDTSVTPINLKTDTIKVALVTASYVPDIDGHSFFSDITNEVSGTGYTAGGKALANVSATKDNTNDRAYIDADDTTWPASTITAARYAILYKDTGSPATSPLIGYIDLGANKSTVADTFYIQWAVPGSGAVLYLG